MAKSSREIVEKRPDEIINACLRLYETKPFQEISLKDRKIEHDIRWSLQTLKRRGLVTRGSGKGIWKTT